MATPTMMASLYVRATQHLECLHQADLHDRRLSMMAEDWLNELDDDERQGMDDLPSGSSEISEPHPLGAEIEPSVPSLIARDISMCCALCGSDDRLPIQLRIEAVESITTLVDAGGASALLANGILAKLILLVKETEVFWEVTFNAISKLWVELDDHMIFEFATVDTVEAIIGASASDRSEVAGVAGWIVCSLAGHEATPTSLKPRAIPVVLAHGRRYCEEAKEEAAWALASMSANPTDAALLVPHFGAVLALLAELAADDVPSVQMQSVWALANLALVVDDTAKGAMAERLIPLLLALIQRAARRQSSEEAASEEAASEEAASEEAVSEEAVPEEASETAMAVRQVLRCLGSLLALPTARQQLLEPSTAFLCLH